MNRHSQSSRLKTIPSVSQTAIGFVGPVAYALLVASGCGGSSIAENSAIVPAIQDMHERSGVEFSTRSVGIRLDGRGAMTLVIEGRIAPKSQRFEPRLFLPLVLTKSLPPHMTIGGESTWDDAELFALHTHSDNWLIVAELTLESPQQVGAAATDVTVEFVMHDGAFAHGVDVLVPLRSTGPVSLSVAVPPERRVSDRGIAVTDGVASVPVRTVLLRGTPPHLGEQILARIPGRGDVLADFSKVEYRARVSGRPFVLVAPFLLLFALLLVLSGPVRVWVQRYRGLQSAELAEALHKTEAEVADLAEGRPSSSFMLWRRPDESFLRYVASQRAGSILRRLWSLRLLEDALRAFALLWVALLLLLTLVILSNALAQSSPEGDRKITQSGSGVLAEFQASLTPHHNSWKPDSVDVALEFLPLMDTAVRCDSSTVSLTVPTSRAAVYRREGQQDGIAVTMSAPFRAIGPTVLVNLRGFCTSLPNGVRFLSGPGYAFSEIYLEQAFFGSIEGSHTVQLELGLRGLLQNRNWLVGSFLHRFPFDGVRIDFPFVLSQPAIVREVGVTIPRRFTGSGKLEWPTRSLSRQEDRLILNDLGPSMRVILPAHQETRITAVIRRPWGQRAFLMLVPLGVAIVGAGVVGTNVAKLKRRWLKHLASGSVALGAPPGIWLAVTSRYDTLPSIVAGEGITVFDVGYLFSWAIFGVLVVLVARWAQGPARRPRPVPVLR